MTEKSNFYDVSEVLKHEQDGTKYVLQFTRKATKFVNWLKEADRDSGYGRRYLAKKLDEIISVGKSRYKDPDAKCDRFYDHYKHEIKRMVNDDLKYLDHVTGDERTEIIDEIIFLCEAFDSMAIQYAAYKNVPFYRKKTWTYKLLGSIRI